MFLEQAYPSCLQKETLETKTEIKIKNNYIGYWRTKRDSLSNFPFPDENSSDVVYDEEYIKTVKDVLDKNSEIIQYRGYSNCRICNKLNGSSEYCINYKNETFCIPQGYFHYLTEHCVKMDDTLMEIIEYYRNQ
jgi:hypothetical protein